MLPMLMSICDTCKKPGGVDGLHWTKVIAPNAVIAYGKICTACVAQFQRDGYKTEVQK